MAGIKKFDKDQALNWAMNEMWLGGFENLSVKAISENLGITRSSFYNTFESKEALFLEAMNLYFIESPHYKLAQFKESKSPLKLLTNIFKETCLARTSDPKHRGCFAVNSVSELVGVNEDVGPIIEKAVKTTIKNFEKLLKLSIQKNELPKDTDAHTLALALQNILMGLNTMSKVVTNQKHLWASTSLNLKALNVYLE